MTDEIQIVRENQDSMEVSKNAKGEFAWKVKAYGDTKTKEGSDDLYKRVKALMEDATQLAKAQDGK